MSCAISVEAWLMCDGKKERWMWLAHTSLAENVVATSTQFFVRIRLFGWNWKFLSEDIVDTDQS